RNGSRRNGQGRGEVAQAIRIGVMNLSWLYALSVVLVGLALPVFSYLTLIYRELGRMSTGRVHEHLYIFEAEIERRLKINRRSGGRTFRILGHFMLAFLVLE